MPKPIHQSGKSFEDINQLIWSHMLERDWHNNPPRGLATSIVLEASELLEHYQWRDKPVGDKDALAGELADILIYAFHYAQVTDIDIVAAIEYKLKVAAEKYPPEAFKNKSQAEREKNWLDSKLKYQKKGL